MSDPRVLHVFSDPRFGGPGTRAISVGKALRSRGITSEFLVPDGPGELAAKARDEGFDVYEATLPRPHSPPRILENVRYLSSFPRTVERLTDEIQRSSCDVVHLNTPYNFQPALAAHRTSRKLIWHFNDTLTPWPLRPLASRFARRWADEIVVAADAVHDYYFDPKAPSRTIYAPVDLNVFDPVSVDVDETALRAELGLDPDVPVVGTVGNINPIKGHESLLRAVASLVDNGNQVTVPIVGKRLKSREEYYNKLRSLRSEFGLDDQVQFVGFRSDIPELLSLFDVFVLPSIAEACPIVVLEAMAMECPVVATDVGGVPEEIPDSDHGWVVPPKDSDALAQAIAAALDNPEESRRRAVNARERVESMFSLEACVDRHEDLYRSLVEEA
ncbi:glycosyltransferase family 4 protein [Halorubrum ezzemoulense]|nr:glycosyltransferase family 4 protein [Halorubrum ezzemoulense]MDB9249150.1 glycosyltransferase family 4 protein [Halorubrum ezzemoulense]MDB9259694.1 glycosyltransferase family 4 protein [Halorubrum ezzemoulense]MDB9263159.1 glycosyltransferase family 4 protein [Halorubrum ezzemoulense]MDB9266411.1 glycosyltransferase family 4 protein [Halorubrum ezzemoulense]MDB9270055.1 glycosyltransferase family 4 protein [Halorubrum ezzemoulense]